VHRPEGQPLLGEGHLDRPRPALLDVVADCRARLGVEHQHDPPEPGRHRVAGQQVDDRFAAGADRRGAIDKANPAAKNTPGSPIYGMPIINSDEAANIVFLRRSVRPGFAGIDSELHFYEKAPLLLGNAKDTLCKLVVAVKDV
jgi:hypothetical protein